MFNHYNQLLIKHQKTIQCKYFLSQVYSRFYQIIASRISEKRGQIIELGSGGGFIKKIIPQCTTSDIVKGPEIDRVLNANHLPYPDNSVATFILLNTFHHFKNPQKALAEMQRCLMLGGKIIMIEPYNSFWSRFIYQNFHHEVFDTHSAWIVKGHNRLNDANIAMPYNIFIRDRSLFRKKFPQLQIIKINPHTPFAYLISGGLSKPQLVPNFCFPLIISLENFLSPLKKHLSMFATYEIKKTS